MIPRRWPAVGAVLLGALVVAIPPNVYLLQHNARARVFVQDTKDLLLSMPDRPIAQRVSPSNRPDPSYAPWVTVGWLLTAARDKKLPRVRPASPELAATQDLNLVLQPLPSGTGVRARQCLGLKHPIRKTLLSDATLKAARGVIAIRNGPSSPMVLPWYLGPLVVTAGPLTVDIAPAHAFFPAQVCIATRRRDAPARRR
jgi:hypothetical protein